VGLDRAEAERLLGFMKFPNVQDLAGYRRLLEERGCEVRVAEDTGLFAPYVNLYREMVEKQLTYDALRVLGFDAKLVETIGGEMAFLADLAHTRKITQGRFVARRS
jgi:hypothetical protein